MIVVQDFGGVAVEDGDNLECPILCIEKRWSEQLRGLTVLVSNIDQTGYLVSLISVSSL